jgi:hypothetical protein
MTPAAHLVGDGKTVLFVTHSLNEASTSPTA